MRLQRAQAVPPSERMPEVAAFVEAMQLDEEACELLPLVLGAAGGPPQPALPPTEATAQRVLLAAAKYAKMCYVSGDMLSPPSTKAMYHLAPYLNRGCGRYPPSWLCAEAEVAALLRGGDESLIGACLWMFVVAIFSMTPLSDWRRVAALEQVLNALEAADRDVLDRQLCQLQSASSSGGSGGSGSLITSRQLQFTCAQQASSFTAIFLRELGPSFGYGTRAAEVTVALSVRSAAMMMLLEPRNPFSHQARGTIVQMDPSAGGPIPASAVALQCLVDGAEEAIRQRRFLMAIYASSSAVGKSVIIASLYGPAALSRSAAQSAVEAFEAAEAALSDKAIKRLLPEAWLQVAAALATSGQAAVPEVRRILASGGRGRHAQQQEVRRTLLAGTNTSMSVLCDGCGAVAQGLRKCSRCRQVGYCR